MKDTVAHHSHNWDDDENYDVATYQERINYIEKYEDYDIHTSQSPICNVMKMFGIVEKNPILSIITICKF